MERVSVLFFVHHIAVCSGQTRYTGYYFAPVKRNTTLPSIRNWQYGIKKMTADKEEDFWKKEREGMRNRPQETKLPSYVRPFSQIRYPPVSVPKREERPRPTDIVPSPEELLRYRRTLFPLHTTEAPLFRQRQYAYQNVFFRGRSRAPVTSVVYNPFYRYQKKRRFSTMKHRLFTGNFSAKSVELPELAGLGWDFIFANPVRPTHKGFKLPPGLGDLDLQRPITKTIRNGFRMLFSDDPKERILGITVNANRNRPFDGFGDQTPGDMVLKAELIERQNKTKWVVTYRNSSHLKNHDLIFYWYEYDLKVDNILYSIYSYDHYFRLFFEFVMSLSNLNEVMPVPYVDRRF